MQQLFYLILTVFREPASQSPSREVNPPPAHPRITPLSGWKNLIFRFLTLVTIFYIPPTSIENPMLSKFYISYYYISNSVYIRPNLSYHFYMPSVSCANYQSKERSFEIYIIIVVTCKEVGSLFLINSGWFGVGIIGCSSKNEICDTKDYRLLVIHSIVFYTI